MDWREWVTVLPRRECGVNDAAHGWMYYGIAEKVAHPPQGEDSWVSGKQKVSDGEQQLPDELWSNLQLEQAKRA
jgi:hypothetical protein